MINNLIIKETVQKKKILFIKLYLIFMTGLDLQSFNLREILLPPRWWLVPHPPRALEYLELINNLSCHTAAGQITHNLNSDLLEYSIYKVSVLVSLIFLITYGVNLKNPRPNLETILLV
jgi:hypothetical protein